MPCGDPVRAHRQPGDAEAGDEAATRQHGRRARSGGPRARRSPPRAAGHPTAACSGHPTAARRHPSTGTPTPAEARHTAMTVMIRTPLRQPSTTPTAAKGEAVSMPGTKPRPPLNRDEVEEDGAGDRGAPGDREVTRHSSGRPRTASTMHTTMQRAEHVVEPSGVNRFMPTSVVNASWTRTVADAPTSAAVPAARLGPDRAAERDPFEHLVCGERRVRRQRASAAATEHRGRDRARSPEVHQGRGGAAHDEVHERLGPHGRRGPEQRHRRRARPASRARRRGGEEPDHAPEHQGQAERVLPEVEGVDRDRAQQAR